MTATAAITAQALRLLAAEIQAPDDVPACCLRDAADLIAAQAAEIERMKREREALVNAAMRGQRLLHVDMLGRWGDLRDAVLHGLDGLDNYQTNQVLSCVDDHFPSDINPAATEESSATENRADKARARVVALERELAQSRRYEAVCHCGAPLWDHETENHGAVEMEHPCPNSDRVAELEAAVATAIAVGIGYTGVDCGRGGGPCRHCEDKDEALAAALAKREGGR